MTKKDEEAYQEIICMNCYSHWVIEKFRVECFIDAELHRCPLCSRKEDE